MKIILVQLGRIGDMILLSSGLPAIKKKYPDGELHILASRHNASALKGNPDVSRIVVYDKSLMGSLRFLRELRRERYDYWIDPKDHYSSESNILARLAKADYKIGRDARLKHEHGESKRSYNNPFDFIVPSDESNFKLHYVERLSNALAPIGVELSPERDRPRLFPSPDSIRFADAFLSGRNGRTIYVNLSASSVSRILPAKIWIEALRASNPERFYAIGAMPRETPQAMEIVKALGKDRAEIYPARNFEDVASIVSLCGGLATPDTAPVHVASAFGTPTLAIYFANAANLNKFRPLAPGSRIIIDENATEAGFALAPELLSEELNKLKLKVG